MIVWHSGLQCSVSRKFWKSFCGYHYHKKTNYPKHYLNLEMLKINNGKQIILMYDDWYDFVAFLLIKKIKYIQIFTDNVNQYERIIKMYD